LVQACAARHIILLDVEKQAVLSAYGLTPLRSRAEVRSLVARYWPELAQRKQGHMLHVLDAAAAGLVAECRLAFNPPRT
jgi:hypothetical protein